jgi:hypothetical protein
LVSPRPRASGFFPIRQPPIKILKNEPSFRAVHTEEPKKMKT